MFELKSVSRWKYFNVDRVDEILENHKKAVILLSGASSSGKSYSAKILQQTLLECGYNSVVISTDSYNKGISGIICDKVNLNYFKNKLENIEKIKEIVKKCIINTDFNEKFNKNDLIKIKKQINNLIDKKDLDLFLKCLKIEFDKINFDEPSVYDLYKVARDINKIINNQTIKEKKYSKVISEQLPRDTIIDGSKIDVVIVEGIYALEDSLLQNLDSSIVIKNFIEGNAKSLFLRRIIRDAKTTSADNCFTIGSYFKYIVPSYVSGILPSKFKADCVLKNDMTFSELRTGDLYATKQKVKVTNPNLIQCLLKLGKIQSSEKHCDIYFCSEGENVTEENLLRLRTIFDEDKKEYVPTSLIHKGAIKNRKDEKIIRPINILIKEGDFFKIFASEQDFIQNMQTAQFSVERRTYKTRIRIKLGEQELTIDDIKSEGVFVEFKNQANPKLIQKIIKYAKTKLPVTQTNFCLDLKNSIEK